MSDYRYTEAWNDNAKVATDAHAGGQRLGCVDSVPWKVQLPFGRAQGVQWRDSRAPFRGLVTFPVES